MKLENVKEIKIIDESENGVNNYLGDGYFIISVKTEKITSYKIFDEKDRKYVQLYDKLITRVVLGELKEKKKKGK